MPKTVVGWLEFLVVVIAGLYTLVHIILGEAHPVSDALGLGAAGAVRDRTDPGLHSLRRGADQFEAAPGRGVSRAVDLALLSGVGVVDADVVRPPDGRRRDVDLSRVRGRSPHRHGAPAARPWKGFVSGALKQSSGSNPGVQGWYAWFLQRVVLNAPGFFSFLITWGEFLVGVRDPARCVDGHRGCLRCAEMRLGLTCRRHRQHQPDPGHVRYFLILSWRVCGWIRRRPLAAAGARAAVETGSGVSGVAPPDGRPVPDPVERRRAIGAPTADSEQGKWAIGAPTAVSADVVGTRLVLRQAVPAPEAAAHRCQWVTSGSPTPEQASSTTRPSQIEGKSTTPSMASLRSTRAPPIAQAVQARSDSALRRSAAAKVTAS